MDCSCRKCAGLVLREGEVCDTYGGDFTWEDTRYCMTRGVFETRGYGAMEWDWRPVEAWEVESLRSRFAGKIAEAEASAIEEAEASAIEEAAGPGVESRRPTP